MQLSASKLMIAMNGLPGDTARKTGQRWYGVGKIFRVPAALGAGRTVAAATSGSTG